LNLYLILCAYLYSTTNILNIPLQPVRCSLLLPSSFPQRFEETFSSLRRRSHKGMLCVECGSPVPDVYKEYGGAGNIRLSHCVSHMHERKFFNNNNSRRITVTRSQINTSSSSLLSFSLTYCCCDCLYIDIFCSTESHTTNGALT